MKSGDKFVTVDDGRNLIIGLRNALIPSLVLWFAIWWIWRLM